MSLLEDLIERAPSATMSAESFITGPDWTLVAASHCGIAASPSGRQVAHGLTPPDLSRCPLGDLLPLALSADPLEASPGVAALNALLQSGLEAVPYRSYTIPRAGGKCVGLVGEFPFVEQLRTVAAEVVVIERDSAPDLLHRVDIAIIPGGAIVDHTMESLLAASRGCYTIVFGPSTPLSPVLFDYGADQLVGVRVENLAEVAKWITAGRENLMGCPGLKSVVLRK
jgi:uncharacterized protein (DUF4213/DUF364 family)